MRTELCSRGLWKATPVQLLLWRKPAEVTLCRFAAAIPHPNLASCLQQGAGGSDAEVTYTLPNCMLHLKCPRALLQQLPPAAELPEQMCFMVDQLPQEAPVPIGYSRSGAQFVIMVICSTNPKTLLCDLFRYSSRTNTLSTEPL